MKNNVKKPENENLEPIAESVTEVPIVEASPLAAEVEQWKNKYLRALADYQNLERRSYGQIDETRKYAAEMVLGKIVSIVDLFEQAQHHLKDSGLALAIKEFNKILAELGVEKIETVGKPFNPGIMECVEVVAGENGIVVTEVSAGYMLYGKMLRVAKVNVGQQAKN